MRSSPPSAARDSGQHSRDSGQRLSLWQWSMPEKRCSCRNFLTAPSSTLRTMPSNLELQDVRCERLSAVVDISWIRDRSRDELESIVDIRAMTEGLLLDGASRGGVGLDPAGFDGDVCWSGDTGSDRACSGSGARSWTPSPTSSSGADSGAGAQQRWNRQEVTPDQAVDMVASGVSHGAIVLAAVGVAQNESRRSARPACGESASSSHKTRDMGVKSARVERPLP
mmetsp:Transcript_198/g.445  ORF Transcript_198/g.445 Transcript_198/m.445 type:complete len:225 (-) Transcript_198:38-712(-)